MNAPQFIHSGAGKKPPVQTMFDHIARRYDLLNHTLSLGLDTRWRKKTLSLLDLKAGETLLDVATGTGDVGLLAREIVDVVVLGLDFSRQMLAYGQSKVVKKKASAKILLVQADAERLPLPNESVDAVTIAYGMRNVGFIESTLAEFYRVLRPGGRTAVLEFSLPEGTWFGPLFNIYFRKILPALGGLFSSRSAYAYLPESVRHFPSRDDFMDLMHNEGFIGLECRDLTFGVSTVFLGRKQLL